ncbi:MAG: iron-sulfur cluster assembly scaffold protein [Candidatus Methylacidiphilales bacterium]
MEPTSPQPSPVHIGELPGADVVGTAGSPGCGDMLRIWLKFRETKDGTRVIDQASYQSFGCETAMAVADTAMQLLAGKSIEEAARLQGADLSAPLGPLPPMKLHCASLVEEALQNALNQSTGSDTTKPLASRSSSPHSSNAPTLSDSLATSRQGGRTIVFTPPPSSSNL